MLESDKVEQGFFKQTNVTDDRSGGK